MTRRGNWGQIVRQGVAELGLNPRAFCVQSVPHGLHYVEQGWKRVGISSVSLSLTLAVSKSNSAWYHPLRARCLVDA